MNKTKNDHYTYLQLNFTRVININKLLKLNFCFIVWVPNCVPSVQPICFVYNKNTFLIVKKIVFTFFNVGTPVGAS